MTDKEINIYRNGGRLQDYYTIEKNVTIKLIGVACNNMKKGIIMERLDPYSN